MAGEFDDLIPPQNRATRPPDARSGGVEVWLGGDAATPEAGPSAASGAFDDLIPGSGVTAPPMAEEAPARPGVAEDMAKGAGAGLMSGVLDLSPTRMVGTIGERLAQHIDPKGYTSDILGAIGSLPALFAKGAAERVTGQELPGEIARAQAAFASGGSGRDLQAAAGLDYDPQTRPGRYAKTIGEFAPGAFIPGASAPTVLGKVAQAVIPAVASEWAGQAAEDAGANPLFVAGARVVGGLAGGAATAVRLPFRAQSSLPASPSLQAPTRADYELAQVDPLFALEGGRGVQQVAHGLAGSPYFGGPVRRGLERTAQQVDEGVERVADQFGGASGSYQAGGAIQRGIEPRIAARGSREADQLQVRNDLAPLTDEPTSRASGRTGVSDTLNARRDTALGKVDAKYAAARAAEAEKAIVPMAEKPVIAAAVRDAVRDYDPITIDAVTRELDRLDNLSTVAARDLFDARSRLTTLRMADQVTASAAGKAVRALDAEIDRVEPMMTGDASVVGLWRDANRSRREFGQQFEGGDLIENLTARDYRAGGQVRRVAAEDSLDAIFGRGPIGNRPNLTRDLTRLRDTLGAESPEWRSLRVEAGRRLIASGETVNPGGARHIDGRKMAGRWDNLRTKSPELTRLLFEGAEGSITGAIDRAIASDLKWTRPQRTVIDEFDGLTEQGAFERLKAMSKTTGQAASFPKIRQLRQAVGEEVWGEVASGMLRNMGRHEDAFSSARFATEWFSMSPGARRAIFGGAQRGGNFSELEALARVAQRQRDAGKLYNHSQSANVAMASGLAAAHATAAVSALNGNMAPLAALAALDTMSYGAARLLASPGFARIIMNNREARNTRAMERQLTAYARENPQVADDVTAFQQALASPAGQRAMVAGAISSTAGSRPEDTEGR